MFTKKTGFKSYQKAPSKFLVNQAINIEKNKHCPENKNCYNNNFTHIFITPQIYKSFTNLQMYKKIRIFVNL